MHTNLEMLKDCLQQLADLQMRNITEEEAERLAWLVYLELNNNKPKLDS